MIARILIAVTATVGVPLAVAVAEPSKQEGSDYYTKKICETTGVTGSRLGRTRRCYTQAERAEIKAQERRVVDHVQSGPGGNPRCLGKAAC